MRVDTGSAARAKSWSTGALGRRAIGLHSVNALTARTGFTIPYRKVPRGSGLRRAPRGASTGWVTVVYLRAPTSRAERGVSWSVIGASRSRRC